MKTAPIKLGLPHFAVLLVAPLLCCLFYARTVVGGSFLSADFLLNVILTKGDAEPSVDWGCVFADFGRGWLALTDLSLWFATAISFVILGLLLRYG